MPETMSSFHSLRKKAKESVLNEYFRASRIAEEKRVLEYNSAIKIQSSWRGSIVRKSYELKREAAMDIERVYRGMKGRQAYKRRLEEREEDKRKAYFNTKATLIQKIYRGWHTRKTHDFYQRKSYLEKIREKNEQYRERQISKTRND